MKYGDSNYKIQNPLESLTSYFKRNNMLVKLILINVGVWVLILVLDALFDLFNARFSDGILPWLAVPAALGKLITRPWTLLTYMFLHFDFWHILFNMLWLYWFGRIFLEYLNQRQLLSTYLFGGLAGAALYILSFNIFPKFQDTYLASMALGASASVMAVVVAISFYVPNYRIHLLFIGPVRIYYIAVLSVLLDVIMIRSSNSGGHLAHIGGALWGLYYVYMLKNGRDLSLLLSKLPNIKGLNPFRKDKGTRFKKVYTNARPVSDEEFNYNKAQRQKKIDKILDKISKSGYDSLTREEKELLFKTSKKDN
jgi:membrane associated rhomboid family serine protease